MAEENKPTTEQEVTPEWAKNLQETLNDLPNRLKEALSPDPQPQPSEPEQIDPSQPLEIPVPQIPEQEEPPQPVELETEQQPEPQKKSKGRKLLDWLF